MDTILSLLRCPEDQTSLQQQGERLICEQNHIYPVTPLPTLLTPTKSKEEEQLRKRMQAFYEQHTFPGYDGIDSPSVLMDKAGRSGFGKWVDEAIPPFATVLEVGCGTGQMTNFLGLVSTRTVIATDQSIASLTLGHAFKEQFGLDNVNFLQANIFAMPFKENSVDVMICSGVLHHTPDPKGGFQALLKLVKPKGKVLIGLYNRYARIPLSIRKGVFKMTGKTFQWLDAHMRRKDIDQSKKEIWFADQYQNPHESWHSVDEVLQWFDESNVTFLSGVPAIHGKTDGKLFTTHSRGSRLQHMFKQISWMFVIGKEGGLFVMIGEKQ